MLDSVTTSIEAQSEHRTAALNAEIRRLKAMLDNLLDPQVLVQPERDEAGRVVDFILVYANRAACEWLRVDAEHVHAARVREILPGIEATNLMSLLIDTADTGPTRTIDAFEYPRDNGSRWIDVRAVRVDEQISLAWRDVTEQRTATEKLAASEAKFRLLAENSSDVVMRMNMEGRITWVSPSLTPAIGWSPAQWIGRTSGSVMQSVDHTVDVAGELRHAIEGRSIVFRTRLAAKGGGVHWVEIHAGPSRAADGSIDGVMGSFRVVDAEVEAAELLERRARTDDLTSLLNRKEAIERIDALTRRTGQRIAVLSCDIDWFKNVNDIHGHAAGDSVLQTVAEHIRGCLRSGDDLAARIGGDELLVVLHGVRDLDDAVAVAEKLRRRTAEPIHTAAGPITVTLSIGVTLSQPSESIDALLARADAAMYQAKNGGRNQVVGRQS
jgi:diguanylate cyclase (GGDEF)-like protein/PAS domain S-box-containing protein